MSNDATIAPPSRLERLASRLVIRLSLRDPFARKPSTRVAERKANTRTIDFTGTIVDGWGNPVAA